MRPALIAAVLAALVVSIAVARWYVAREQRVARGDAGRRSQSDDSPGRTDPQGSTAAPTSHPHRSTGVSPLVGIPAIRHFFRTNETPVYFVSATAFNLLGIDRWVRNFKFVNYYDSFDGWHPNVFVPAEQSPRAFESIEDICNYLLGHKEVVDYVGGRGPGGKVAFLMFDEETETLAADLGLEVAFPPAELRHRLDSKIETTRLANEAGVPSVPNVMGRASNYRDVLDLAAGAGLGDDLVIQTPYGDSGQTTFFIADESDWKADEDQIVGQDLKVMKRIDPRETAIEGVITRHGTLVGPLMAELTGFPELTPYDGGWCGNDVFPDVLTPGQRLLARERTYAVGERLRREGYRGYFELDFLADAGSGEMYLGELNPRVTGASSITNVTAVAYGDMPLFLFHLLEFMDVDYEIDVEELNRRWAHPGNLDEWTQFILKQTEDTVELITEAPSSGIWRMGHDGTISFARRDTDWHTVADGSEAFYLRIADAGGYRYPGADLGILVTRGRFLDDDHELVDRARSWITGIKSQFRSVPPPERTPPPVEPEPFGFKML
ncbi:MAG: biotin carboxylase [Actinomycetota bacterium]|nr:biotin carboxylase [Actinomycetota bacterium]